MSMAKDDFKVERKTGLNGQLQAFVTHRASGYMLAAARQWPGKQATVEVHGGYRMTLAEADSVGQALRIAIREARRLDREGAK